MEQQYVVTDSSKNNLGGAIYAGTACEAIDAYADMVIDNDAIQSGTHWITATDWFGNKTMVQMKINVPDATRKTLSWNYIEAP